MVDEVFKNLVDQFSDPFTCLRELVQNAMDAGTESVEIRTKYLPDPGGVCLEIRDFGEGMNRAIIESKLTRLFSSDKEDDLTKIGKFGIGFVSVFSLKPELVIVDTGRDGEFWRIAFDGGTDFQLFELHEPLEGTSVRIHKLLPYEDFDEFSQRCLTTVSAWCRHSDVTLLFNGEKVNRDLVVDSLCRVDNKSGLGHFNLGVHPSATPPYGLYNTGLTLTEGHQESWPGVTYKILSNHLEHTLTRDAVIQDENYEKVSAKLEELIKDDLFKSVTKVLRDPENQEEAAAQAKTFLQFQKRELSSSQRKLPFVNDVFGKPVSFKNLQDCAEEEDRLFVSSSDGRLAERANREGIPVLPFDVTSQMADTLSVIFEVPVVRLEENLAVSQPVERPPGFRKLETTLRSLLREGRILVTSVVPVEYPESVALPGSLPCTFALGPDRLVRRFRRGFWATKYLLPQQLLLDVNHPLVRKALTRLDDVASRRVASYAICKSALLNDGLDPSTETRLLGTMVDVT